MEKSNNSTSAIMQGQLLRTEDGNQYFISGKYRIKVSEHFAKEGKTLDKLIEGVIRHTTYRPTS